MYSIIEISVLMGAKQSTEKIETKPELPTPEIDLQSLTFSENIFKFRVGECLCLPVIKKSVNKEQIKDIQLLINELCASDPNIKQHDIVCYKIDTKDDQSSDYKSGQGYKKCHLKVYFIIPKYFNERSNILNLLNGDTIMTRDAELCIETYKKDTVNRVQPYLEKYYLALKSSISKQVNTLLVKSITGTHTINIQSNRDLDELVVYVQRFPELIGIILNKLKEEAMGTRIIFKDLQVIDKKLFYVTIEIEES